MSQSSLSLLLRALRHRNYRLFFGGQIVSLTGTWMTSTAASWLVFRLSGSATMLGVAGFVGQLPAFLLAPASGITVDRADKRRLLVATQTLSMLQSFALAALTLSGRAGVPAVLALLAVQGVINAFDVPCRQAFLISMIEDREDLGNAIALNSSTANAARLIGPSIAGLLIAAANEGWCFLIDGASYLAVIGALLAMRLAPAAPRAGASEGAMSELREGLAYTFGSLPIRSLIQLLALVSLVGAPYAVLMPVFAQRVLGGGPHTLGFLLASSGCGAFLGALWLASRRSVLGLSRVIPAAAAGFGLSLICVSYARSMGAALPLLVAAGFCFMAQLGSSNTILQTIVDDDKRGRVMGYFIMSFLGTAPFGSLLTGTLADRIGTPNTLRCGGTLCIAGGLWFLRRLPGIRKVIRPIYERMGILPAAVPEAAN